MLVLLSVFLSNCLGLGMCTWVWMPKESRSGHKILCNWSCHPGWMLGTELQSLLFLTAEPSPVPFTSSYLCVFLNMLQASNPTLSLSWVPLGSSKDPEPSEFRPSWSQPLWLQVSHLSPLCFHFFLWKTDENGTWYPGIWCRWSVDVKAGGRVPSLYQASWNFISLILVFADVSGFASYTRELDLFIVSPGILLSKYWIFDSFHPFLIFRLIPGRPPQSVFFLWVARTGTYSTSG